MTAILGISAFYHDAAAALIVDGRIIAAAQEERFTRNKHDAGFPGQAIDYCLREAGLSAEQLDYVGFYDKPLLKFERLLETYLAYAPAGFKSFLRAMPLWLHQKLHLPREIAKGLHGRYRKKYVFTQHHVSHAASAFYPSPYDEAAILTLDGVGEWATCSFGVGQGNRIELSSELHFPHSLGLLYSAFTDFVGFNVNGDEYKLMGLAPYGEPKHVDLILDNLLDLKPDGSFRLDMSYFNYCQGLTMTTRKFEGLFGRPPRRGGQPITRSDMDIAASIQRVTEEIMLRQARHVQAQTGMKRLCLAGGVALNCVGNGRLLREGPFEAIWVQPAAGDAGGALGVAQYIWYQLLDNPRRAEAGDSQRGSLLGPQYGDRQIAGFLRSVAAIYQRVDDDEALCGQVAAALEQGQVVGWYQGRMEFGPRALGSRSILGDARDPAMQETINRKVKFREGFRPFAPIVLAEHAHKYFELEPGQASPYMLLTAPVRADKRLGLPPEPQDPAGTAELQRQRSVIPAVTHVDYSARVQTVDPRRHGLLRRLLERFNAQTGCPVLVNTSFNLGWDPIVCTPQDAYRMFMACDIDLLAMGHYVLRKAEQPATVTAVRAGTTDEVFEDKLASPCVAGGTAALMRRGDRLICAETGHEFAVTDQIPQLFWPHEQYGDSRDRTEIVKAFYEQTPFPNYDDQDSVRALIEKARAGRYARRLDETIPYNAEVLEIGCGTGQLTNFLGSSCRRVIGTDMCLNSLRLGEAFRREQGLVRVRFMQMNLFRPALRPARFDVVLCNGVLHHTSDPYRGLMALVPLLKPGGHLVLGLYNRYGRLATDLRRHLLRRLPGSARWIDPILRRGGVSAAKRQAWFADQYLHPHESKHTCGEVLRWFEQTGLELVRGIPALRPDDDGLAGESLFEPQPRGTALERLVVQASQIIAPGQAEGGFFTMIGRKPS
ncbi:carbamoyltransferase N-terminal domain-containing protein [Candidatus Thiosymbion oneisti]|uniref:carbamoyltransferase N-terminal domain-containing protein n=1 Tax=Candidatus Thiosymbion oneisti TaxID=589554 RepID=UPI000B202CEB|nr:carbamoyltransferase N-terminal domain-containing protein [Candidatus Thiosymbion oneisti]